MSRRRARRSYPLTQIAPNRAAIWVAIAFFGISSAIMIYIWATAGIDTRFQLATAVLVLAFLWAVASLVRYRKDSDGDN